MFKTKFDMYQTLILWYIPHYFPKVSYYIFVSLLINTININNNKPLLIPDVIRNYILLKMENHRGGKENFRCFRIRKYFNFLFQVKITGWIFHGVWVVRGELLREIVYKSAIFIYFDIQKTFYCWINICSKTRKRSFVSLAVFMFKKNPKNHLFYEPLMRRPP